MGISSSQHRKGMAQEQNPLQEDGMNQIDYKGSFIEVCIDTSTESSNEHPVDALADSFGFVVDGHPVEL